MGGGRGRGGPIGGGGIPPPPPEGPAMLPSSGSGGDETTTTTIGNMTPEQASRQFDIHRREATRLERQLEDRVARYQQVRVCVFLSPYLPRPLEYIYIQSSVLVCVVCGGRSNLLYIHYLQPPSRTCADLPISTLT